MLSVFYIVKFSFFQNITFRIEIIILVFQNMKNINQKILVLKNLIIIFKIIKIKIKIKMNKIYKKVLTRWIK